MKISSPPAIVRALPAGLRIRFARRVAWRWRVVHCAIPFVAAAFVTALLSPLQAGAQSRYSAAGAAMLPAYCRQDVTGIHYTLEERQRWDQILGSGIDSIHHYCRGLNWTNTALFFSKNRQERTDALGYSLQEFDFILNQTDTSHFKLLPEVLTKKGENLIRLRRFPEALPVLQKAIQVKPDYWPPYAVLSDYFRDVGDIPKAHEWLDKALAIDPNAKSLKVRQTELAQAKVKAPSASVQKTAKQTDKAAEPEKSASPKPAAEAKPAAK